MTNPSDVNLAAADPALPSGEGHQKTFVSLFLSHQSRIHGFIVALLASQQDAEDLVQETAEILWRKFAEFQPGTSFFAWASRTAYLVVLEYRRKKSREIAPLENEVLEQLAAFAAREDAVQEVRLSALDQCLKKLSSRDRDLINQCYSVETKVRLVAADLARSAKSVRKSLGRIRRTLLECVRRTVSAAEREGGRL